MTISSFSITKSMAHLYKYNGYFGYHDRVYILPSITDGVHRNENFVEIIPVFSTFSTFSNFFKKRKKNIKAI